jgi:predicted PurR-regulated permease PerM
LRTGNGALQKIQETATEVQRAADAAAGGAAAGATPPARQASSPMDGFVWRGSMNVVALAGHVVAGLFFVFFILVSGHDYRARVLEVAGGTKRKRITREILDEIDGQIQRFLLVLIVTSVVVALATWLWLTFMGVQHAIVWALVAGIFNSIPYFGPVVVTGGLFLVGLMQLGGLAPAFQVAAGSLVITSLEGWLLTPALMGRAARMNALAVFAGLLAWTWIWGVWGTILAVPMLMIVKSVCDQVEDLKPVARLLAE